MPKVIVFGSVNKDHVYSVPHIVTPGETISSTGLHVAWGGKGLNQAIALAKAGAQVSLAGKVNSADFNELAALGKKYHLDTGPVACSEQPTGHAIIQVDRKGQNSIVIFAGANGDIRSDDIRAALKSLKAGDLVLLQNEISGNEEIIRRAKAAGALVALNPSPFRQEIMSWPLEQLDYIILNEVEAAQMTGFEDHQQALDSIAERYPRLNVILTLGGEGSMYARGEVRIRVRAADTERIVDTTAAGDTYTGYVLTELLNGSEVEHAMTVASKAAAICIMRPGAVDAIPWRDELT